MPVRARIYIVLILMSGLAVISAGLWHWQIQNSRHYTICLLLSLIAAALKIKLPGMTGTISMNFVLVLVAMAEFSFGEMISIGCTATLVQSLWRAKRRPKPVQVVFNVAAVASAIAVSYAAFGFTYTLLGRESLVSALCLTACLFYVVNAGLISIVVSLAEKKPLGAIWHQCCLWSIPYYVTGAVVAAVSVVAARNVGWESSLLVLPMMALVFVFFRLHVDRVAVAAND